MLSFLNAGVLFAAAAALIPLIIHLFSKRRVKVVEFSSLKHLKAMQRRQVRRLKIRQLLLLLLRMLIILAIVLAFARPTTQNEAIGTHAAVSAVVVIDNSESMNRYVADGNLFEIARTRAEKLLETFSQGDEVMLLTTSSDNNAQSRFGSPAVALEALSSLEPGELASNLSTSLKFAAQQLNEATNLNKELYLITDRQRYALPEEPVLEELNAPVYLVDLPIEAFNNAGLTEVDFGGQLIRPGLEFTLSATIKNFGNEAVEDQIASLYLDNNRVAQTDFGLEAEGQTVVQFNRAVARPGYHTGWVELTEDRLPDDNKFYFSFRIPEDFSLLIVEGDASAAYASLALSPGENLAQYWSIKRAKPSELTGVDFNDYDAVMLLGAPRLEANYTSRLKSFVNRGKSLFISFGGATNIDDFNRSWSNVARVVYTRPAPTNFSRAGYYTFGSIDQKHPIFSVFDLDKSKLPEVKFFALPEMKASEAATTLIEFTGGRPALVESKYGNGRVLTFTAPLDPTYSDMVGHSFFVPLISRIAEYLASDLSALETDLTVGASVVRNVDLEGELDYPLELIAPDSTRYAIQPEESDERLTIRTEPLKLPGLYRIVYLGRELDQFAVNVDPAESDLTPADPDQIQSALGLEDLRQLPEGKDIGEVLAGFRFGRELWPLFVWAAVILLILEMILARGSRMEELDAGD